MKNNLRKQIILNDFKELEFAKLAFPEVKEHAKLRRKLTNACEEKQITFNSEQTDHFCNLLNCDYNTLLGYEKS